MNKTKSIFQIVILIIFGLFAILGLIFFATYSAKTKEKDIGRVIIWGTVDQGIMNKFLQVLRNDNQMYKKVLYAQYPAYKFNEKVTDALAAGEGPDIIIISHEDLLKYKNKIYPISYKTFDKRSFMDTFIDGAYIFMAPEGILGIPFAVDPMLLYYNRDIFADNLIVEPPKLWKEVIGMSKKITTRDAANNIDIASISLGAYENVTNAYGIIAMLSMQADTNITLYNYNTGELKSGFVGEGAKKASSAIRFYTAFANPVSNIYTWNRSLPESIELFAQDKLAMYIGFASDLSIIQSKNPHLNFDVTEMPQVDKKDKNQQTRTYGKFWIFAITKASKNKRGAYQFAVNMLQPKYSKLLADMLGVSYVQRSLLKEKPDDPLKLVFRNSAIISRAFLDPNKSKTEQVLSKMINNIISGQSFVDAAVSQAGNEINNLINEYLEY